MGRRFKYKQIRSKLVSEAQRASADATALRHLEDVRVNTIHGFCADLLHVRPMEAEVDPQFQTLTEAESERLFAQTFDTWIQENLEDPPEGIRRSLRRTAVEGPIGA